MIKRVIICILILLFLAASSLADYPIQARTKESAVNMRQSPRTNGKVIEKVRKGTQVTVTGDEKSNGVLWYAVTLKDGRSGYIKAELLELEQQNVENIQTQQNTQVASYSQVQQNSQVTSNNQNSHVSLFNQPSQNNQTYHAASYNQVTQNSHTENNITFSTAHTGGSSYNNVGNQWTFYYELDGSPIDKAGCRCDFVAGKEYKFYTRIKEQDAKPDTGTNTVKYTPTPEDIIRGFKVEQRIKVAENGGKYKGKAVTWTVIWNIKPL